MKLQKSLLNLATLSMLGFLSVACNSGGGGATSDRYAEGLQVGKQQGYKEGYDVGYDDGYADGDEAGFARAKDFFASADYLKGFEMGKVEGIAIGYSNGYNVGRVDGRAEGYDMGYDDGYLDGEEISYTAGYDDGMLDGYDMGYDDGALDGYDLGYDDGMADGYDFGYDDGFADGYGLSVGKTKKLKGYANVLSMFHNDLIDYSKIKAPKQTKRGLVANGTLLLSETSVTNKDTLKRKAVVEQYLITEMAKQVKGKFGLSAERSMKIAKAANHFRKYSSKRALTAEDTNAYATEIIGSNFDSITKAYESGLRGDLSGFNSVMEKAAAKNGTSPEKMSEIMTKLFI